MEYKLDLELRAYNKDFNSNICYRLNDFERKTPEILIDIIKTIEAQMAQHIKLKELSNG